MARTVYLETSIISYLVARPRRDLVTAARQELTREWWEQRRAAFDVYVSEAVIAEARAGDSEAAARRLAILADLPLLEVTPEVTRLAGALAKALQLPQRAAADALHVATAACHGMEFLLTWNSTYIANAELRPTIEEVSRSQRIHSTDPLYTGRDHGRLKWHDRYEKSTSAGRTRSLQKSAGHARSFLRLPVTTSTNSADSSANGNRRRGVMQSLVLRADLSTKRLGAHPVQSRSASSGRARRLRTADAQAVRPLKS